MAKKTKSAVRDGLDTVKRGGGGIGKRRTAPAPKKNKRAMTAAVARAVAALDATEGALQLILQRGKQNGRADRIRAEVGQVLMSLDRPCAAEKRQEPETQLVINS